VVHLPTGKNRILIGLEGADPDEVALRLTDELTCEINAEKGPPAATEQGIGSGPIRDR
jgi:hypothetical protein